MARCKAEVPWGNMQYSQCQHQAVTLAGYCKQHDPDLRRAKQGAKYAAWCQEKKAESDKRALERRQLAAFGPLLEAAKEAKTLLWTSLNHHPISASEERRVADMLDKAIAEAEGK